MRQKRSAVMVLAAVIVLFLMCGQFSGYFHIWGKKEPRIKVVCVGDSITYGSGVKKHRKKQSYPAFLQKKLGRRYQVFNYGLSGRTLLDFSNYPYVAEEAYQKSLEEKADIYILMLGTNDSKLKGWNADEYERQLKIFIESYQQANEKADIYIMQPSRCFPDRKTGLVGYLIKNEIIESEILPSVAKVGDEMGVSVINLYSFTQDHEEWFVDGVHPNAVGNVNIAEYVFQNITSDVQ